jgi:serine/threonine protein kinase
MPDVKGKSRSSEATYLPPDTMLEGKYRIVQPIAEGGMGVVYRAEHILMKKVVAIKRLHRNLMSLDQVVARFEREAQAAAKIDHPNVCTVTDCGKDSLGVFFIVMEFLEGESLQNVLDREKRLPPARLLSIAIQICAGLDKAHSMGVIHRDLKPENIMLIRKEGREDIVKIMDFGIAKMITDETPATSLTQAGMIFGTPHFLSPEQAAGDTIDHRSDLYSLGVIMFAMATGQYLFDDQTVGGLLRKHISSPPPTLIEAAPDLGFPDGLQPILDKLLAKNPDDRYASAHALREHLLFLQETSRMLEQATLDQETSVQVSIVDDVSFSSRPITIPVDVESPRTGPLAAVEPAPARAAPPPIDRPVDGTLPPHPVYSRFGDMWRRNTRLRVLVVTLSLVCAGVLLVVILSFTKILQEGGPAREETSPERIQAALEQKRALFNEQPEITNILSLSVDKKDDEALEALLLLKDKEAFRGNPHYYYHLANIQARSGAIPEALASIESCLSIEPDYAYDPMTLEVLVAGLHDPEGFTVAAGLLRNHVNVTMKDTLERLAREDASDDVRRTALAALKRKNLLAALEPWQRSAIVLADADASCEEKRVAFALVRDLDEKALLPTLELIAGGRSCEKQKCSHCLGEELEEKIRAMTGGPGEGHDP